MEYPSSVAVCDVGPRDGFQMEEAFIPTERKVAVVDALSRAGLPEIEATSFVHPRAILQMRDAEEVMAGVTRRPETQYTALVPNAVGARRALAAGVGGLGVVVAASELPNRANVNMTHDESFANLAQIVELAAPTGVPVVLGIATGVDLDKLLEAASLAEQVVGRTLPGQVVRSGPRWHLTPIPALLQEPAGPKRPHDIAALTAHRRKC